MKEKSISLRITQDLYLKCLKISLKESKKEGKVVSVSEIIRKILEEKLF